ncbi:hypothetical protein ACIBI8_00530 [Streptomyces sp. NPDC050529]|uniref:hypothetical protein n=1 Tax=Streptomyces sp. NPDC050529 TaxID=3365624 RepID=UPI0037AFC4EF
MKRTRAFTCAAAVLVAGLLAGASGCSSTPEDTGAKPKPTGSPTAAQTGAEQVSVPEERACKGGTYTWFNMQEQSVLNGVTDVQRVTGKPTKLTEPMRRLRTDQGSLTSDGPTLDSQAVLFALSVHLGFAEKGGDPQDGSGMGEPGAYAPIDEGGGEVSGHAARLVNYSAVTKVDVDFRYTCKGGEHREPTVGHVSTWSKTTAGVLNCEEPLPKDAAAAHEAKRLSCGR